MTLDLSEPLATYRGFCSDTIEVAVDGRRVVVKRPHDTWVTQRLRLSRIAASLLERRTGVIAPQHLDVSHDQHGAPIEAYWHIPQLTLAEVWPDIATHRRAQALRSWGALLRRLHKVRLSGFGDLHQAQRFDHVFDYLSHDLRTRLLPALHASWSVAVPVAEELLQRMHAARPLHAERTPILVHDDFHMGNVLVERRPRTIRCVGAIDLETAWAGIPEADHAKLQVLYGPAFDYPLGTDWFAHFSSGYGRAPDARLLRLLRVHHRLNLGYFAATQQWLPHASDLHQENLADLRAIDEPAA